MPLPRTQAVPKVAVQTRRLKLTHSLIRCRSPARQTVSGGGNRTEFTTMAGARSWCGHGIFTHNLVKISALPLKQTHQTHRQAPAATPAQTINPF
jgi:hypothetical protein